MSKILLVEDDNNLREIYEARLQAEGYTIISARDGEEALVFAKSEKPDLVISDVMMPKISGFEMLDILRNTEGLKQVKVIMLTALGQSDDQQRATRLGADHYLVKSQVTLEDIVKVAHELLQDEPFTPPVEPAAPEPAGPVVPPTPPIPAPPVSPPTAPAAEISPAPEPAPVAAAPVPSPIVPPPIVPPPSPSVSNAPVATMPAMTTSEPAPAPVTLPPTPAVPPAPVITAPSPVIQPTVAPAPAPVVAVAPPLTTTEPSPTPAAAPITTPVPELPVIAVPTEPSVPVVTEAPTPPAPEPSVSNVTTEGSSIKKEIDDTSNSVAQSTAQEEASVEAKIEDFVAGASSTPDKPIPDDVDTAAETSGDSAAITQPEAPVTAPVITPAENSPSATAPATTPVLIIPSAPMTSTDAASDDKVMADAVNTLIADTQQSNKESTGPNIISVTPSMSSSPSASAPVPAEHPSTALDTVPVPNSTNPGSVPIAHKKIISPVDSAPKQDLNTLLALEAAKESVATPSAPAIVMGTNDDGQQPAAAQAPSVPPPPAVPPPLPGLAQSPAPAAAPAPVSDNPLDPNNIAL